MISSVNNSLIKNIVKLRKISTGKKEQEFIVEGCKEINQAIQNSFAPRTIRYTEEFLTPLTKKILNPFIKKNYTYKVSKKVFAKLAIREKKDGLIFVFKYKNTPIKHLASNTSKILILEKIEKPGNVGAIIRTAVASGITTLIIIGNHTPYNHNTIRNSIGLIFKMSIYSTTITQCITYLKNNHIQLIATSLKDTSIPYNKIDFTKPTAIILGSEAHGISSSWNNFIDRYIKIPMSNDVDSLNVAVSSGIILYEWKNKTQ